MAVLDGHDMDTDKIKGEIERFVRDEKGNRLPGSGHIYDEPLVGFAAATDPLFQQYKEVIGPFHLTPRELLPTAATVIVWILPMSLAVRSSNRRERERPSREWAWARSPGEDFNMALRGHISAWLQAQGYASEAPMLSKAFRVVQDSPVGEASVWSERHAAFVAGLGTFSLSDGFITARGIAHRCGSVVTSLPLPPSPRNFGDHRANCLFYNGGKCGLCINRCPAGAITEHGHDKRKCRAYVFGAATAAAAKEYGVPVAGCGFCQTGVPCEACVPRK